MTVAEKDTESRSVSTRTCVGCRKADSKSALLRFAVSDTPPFLVPDARARLGGRGASVHPRRACLQAAVSKGGFSRAFKRPLAVDALEVARLTVRHYRERADGLLLAARRNGSLALGADSVRETIRNRTAHLLVVATDAASTPTEIARVTPAAYCLRYGTKEALGKLLGREAVAIVSITDAGIAEELSRAARRADDLGEGLEDSHVPESRAFEDACEDETRGGVAESRSAEDE